MNLTSWLRYLETLPSGLNNNSLNHVKTIAQKLDLLNFPGKIITVGGTNGKGSCVVFLEAVLLKAGYTTGTYISPHLLRYNERIRINSKEASNKTLCKAFAQVESARKNIILSYFEYTTLTALNIFKKQNLDFLILEVGLGGKYDAVNILNADISIITTISLDHTKILGNTREIIGNEKSGIMRPFKPVICGDNNAPKSISTNAKKNKSILYCANKDFTYTKQNKYWNWFYTNTKEHIKNLPIPKLPIASASCSLMAIKLLQNDFKILKKDIISGLKTAFLPGRFQTIIINNKKIILDVAHNQESALLLAQNLAGLTKKGRILAITSVLANKDIISIFKPLSKMISKWYLVKLKSPRAASILQLEQSLIKVSEKNFVSFQNTSKALQQAFAEYKRNDKIVIFGSFLTVAEGLKFIYFSDFLITNKKYVNMEPKV